MPTIDGETDWIEVFRSGTYPQGEVTPEEVQQIAADYDPAVLEAAATVDHQREGPSYGWVSAVRTEDTTGPNGERAVSLYARFRKMATGLYQRIFEDESMPRRSVEILNGYAGYAKYLGAVTFLGVKPPAVAAMEPVGRAAFSHEPTLYAMPDDTPTSPDEDTTRTGSDENAPAPPESDDEADATGAEGTDDSASDADEDDTPDGDEDEPDEEEEEEDEDPGSDSDEEDVSPEEYADAVAERDRLRAELQRERQERAEAEVQAFCAQHLPPALRDDAQAILTSLEGANEDVIVFEHDEHDDLATAFRAFLEQSMSFSYLFDEYATDGPDADNDGVPRSREELAQEIRNNMAGA